MTTFNEKKGVYIVEAAILLPIFIIGLVVIISIIPVIAKVENVVFCCTDELRMESVLLIKRHNPIALPMKLKGRVMDGERSIENFFVFPTAYLDNQGPIDNALAISWQGEIGDSISLGLFKKLRFEGQLMARPFIGNTNALDPTDENEFRNQRESRPVYVFPNSGEKYHSGNCRIVKSETHVEILTASLKKKYSGCKKCNSKDIPLGSQVVCSSTEGSSYHRASCAVVDKYYIQMDVEIAKKRGYYPCQICGGS